MMKVFVIIVTYNGKKWYDRCFSSLKNSTVPLSVIVIDNASSDGTVQYLKEKYPGLTIIESKTNLGFGRANNIGIRHALDHDADYVFLLNQDAWIESDTIEKLIEISKINPEFGILSPIHMNVEKMGIEKLLLDRLTDNKTTDKQWINNLYCGRLKDVYETRYVNAAAWFMPKSVVETVGGFDPIFFHYGEDDNFLNRVFYHGFKVGICPKLTIVHDNDRERPMYDSRELEILMLIDYTNINKDWNLSKEKRTIFRKIITSALRLRSNRCKDLIKRYKFLKKNDSAIEYSRMRNVLVGTHWL